MSDSNTYNDPNKLAKAHQEGRFVFNDYARSKDLVVDRKREQFKEGYKGYRAVHDWKDDGVMTRLVEPLIYINVEEALPRMVANLPRVEVGPRGPEDEVRATKHRHLLFWDWDILQMAMKLILIAKSGEIFGTCFTKSPWKKKVETRLSRRVVPTRLGTFGVAEFFNKPATKIEHAAVEVETWNDPWLDIPWPDQIFPEPGAADIPSSRYIIHRIRTSLHDIKSARKDGQPLYRKGPVAELEKLLQGGNPAADQEETLEQMVRQDFHNQSDVTTNDPHNREVHLLEWWSDSKVVVVVEEFPQIPPLRMDFNELGRKPFSVFTPIPDIGSIYGIAMSETLMAHQVMRTILNGVTIDNLLYSVHQMYTVLRNSGITARNLAFRPGGLIPVKTQQDIQPLQRAGTDFSIYRTMQELDHSVQKVGFGDPFVGARTSGATATEASLLFEASQTRTTLMFQILGLQHLTDWGRLNVRLNELYLDSDKPVRVMGDEFNPFVEDVIRPEELLSGTGLDLDVKIDISQTEPTNRAFRLARAKDMLGTLANAGFPIQSKVMQFVVSELLRGYGKDRPEQLLQNDPAIAMSGLLEGGGAEGGSDLALGNAAEQLAVAAEEASPEVSAGSAGGLESAGDLLF